MKKIFLYLVVMLCILPIECYASNGEFVHNYGFLIVLLLALFVFPFVYERSKDKKGRSNYEIDSVSEEIGYSKEELKAILFGNFKKIYEALNIKDLDTLKKLCSSEIYDAYCSQFNSLDFLNRKRIIEDFDINSFKIVDVYREKTRIVVKVNVVASYFNYIVNNKDELIKGRKDILIKKKWDVVFVKKNIDFDSIKKCPHCLEDSKSDGKGNCLNCNKNVVSYKDDFILIKKKSK